MSDFRNEIQLINHYINSRDLNFLVKNNIDSTFFISTKEIVEWIEEYVKRNNSFPTLQTVKEKFEDFEVIEELDAVQFLVDELRKNKISIEFKPILMKTAEMMANGEVIEAVNKMRLDVEKITRTYTGKIERYDWVKDANSRYEEYLKTHKKEGLGGISTGINKLDDLTGGWKADDLVLVAGRLGEGKSLVSAYFAYHAWWFFMKSNMNVPVIYISTEMPELEVAYRLDTMRAHFSNRELNQGKLQDVEAYKEYLEELEKKTNSLLILTEDSNKGKAFTPNDIRSIIESERPGLIVVDQLYDLSDGIGEQDIRKRIVNVSNQIRDVNMYTQTPIIWVAQAGRESAREAKRDTKASPELYHVQESDTPAQKSTKVITLRLINNEVIKLSLKKNRGGKKDEDIYLRADIDRGYYGEIEEEALAF